MKTTRRLFLGKSALSWAAAFDRAAARVGRTEICPAQRKSERRLGRRVVRGGPICEPCFRSLTPR